MTSPWCGPGTSVLLLMPIGETKCFSSLCHHDVSTCSHAHVQLYIPAFDLRSHSPIMQITLCIVSVTISAELLSSCKKSPCTAHSHNLIPSPSPANTSIMNVGFRVLCCVHSQLLHKGYLMYLKHKQSLVQCISSNFLLVYERTT